MGAVLTQNTAWSNVERAINNLRRAGCLEPDAILRKRDTALAGLLKPSGYFNVKAKRLKNLCSWYCHHGEYRRLRYWSSRRLRESLLAVNGIGPETADDILLYAFSRPVFVVDAYTHRIFSRLGQTNEDDDYHRLQDYFHHHLPSQSRLFNEYHALIVMHGKTTCRARPLCEHCCLRKDCSFPG